MPHFQTVQPFGDERFDLPVSQQGPVTPGVSGVGDNRHPARTLDRGHHVMCGRRWRGNVIFRRCAHRVGERVGSRFIHAGSHQCIGDMRPTDRGAFAFTHLREHIIPRNRKILRHQFDHALGSTQSRLAGGREHLADIGVQRIILERKHMHGHIAVDGGDFRATQQRQSNLLRSGQRILPTGGRVMIGNRNTMQSQ